MALVSTVLDLLGVSRRSTACVHRFAAESIEPFAEDAHTMTVQEHWGETRCGVTVRRWIETKQWVGSPETGWLRADVTGPTVASAAWQKEMLDAAFYGAGPNRPLRT